MLLVEPAYTRTGFDAKAMQPDVPLPIYAGQRHVFDGVMARAMEDGDDPAIVANAIVAAVTDPKPKLRYTAGSRAGRALGHSQGRTVMGTTMHVPTVIAWVMAKALP